MCTVAQSEEGFSSSQPDEASLGPLRSNVHRRAIGRGMRDSSPVNQRKLVSGPYGPKVLQQQSATLTSGNGIPVHM